jgi:GDP-L-fucose synthase
VRAASEVAAATGARADNEPYAIAKIAGIKSCQAYRRQYGSNFISAMPTNLYGPNDNFDLKSSHVLPAMMRKFHEAKLSGAREVVIWGTGVPRREFLHVDDLADACVFVMANYEGEEHINVGTGEDLSIAELARTVREIVYPDATLTYDTSKPDRMRSSLTSPACTRSAGAIESSSATASPPYRWFLENQDHLRLSAVSTGSA